MAVYLVTGGAGFIGSHIVEELVRRRHQVRVLDNFSTGREENLAAVRSQIELWRADIRDVEKIKRCCEGVDYVVHEAALPSVERSLVDPLTSNAVNIDGTLNVLVAARDAGVKRVVFAGSSSAYGNGNALPRVELQETCPLSPYALTKVTGERYCEVFARLYGLETVTLRYFNIFGPRQELNSPYSGVISIFLGACLRGETPVLFGDGEQMRDFTFVDNAVEATLRACTAPAAVGKIINIGGGKGQTLNQLIERLNEILGSRLTPRHAPPRAGDVHTSYADITQARRILDYEPKIGFEEGLRRTVEWSRFQLASKETG
jgi:nucleoside-diphosphate-sugar epimerase